LDHYLNNKPYKTIKRRASVLLFFCLFFFKKKNLKEFFIFSDFFYFYDPITHYQIKKEEYKNGRNTKNKKEDVKKFIKKLSNTNDFNCWHYSFKYISSFLFLFNKQSNSLKRERNNYMKRNDYEYEVEFFEENNELYIRFIISFLMLCNFGFIYFCREVLNLFNGVGNIFIFTDIFLVLTILIYFLFEKIEEEEINNKDN
jgi:hypothetical protein